MSKVCPLTGKRPMRGHKVSHSNRKSLRRTLPNLQERRLWSPAQNRWVKVRLSIAALRTIDKIGVDAGLALIHARAIAG